MKPILGAEDQAKLIRACRKAARKSNQGTFLLVLLNAELGDVQTYAQVGVDGCIEMAQAALEALLDAKRRQIAGSN